jgi:ATP-binding cassette subfamily B protein
MNASPHAAPSFSVNMAGRSMGPGGGHRFGAGAALPKPRSARATLRRLAPLLRPHAATLATVAVFVLVGTLATLATPWLVGHSIDALRRRETGVARTLWMFSVLLATAYAANFASALVQSWSMVGVSQRIVARLRADLFDHLQRLPLRFFDTRSDGDILSRFQNDLDNLSNTLSQNGVQLLGSVASVAGALALMVALDWRLALAGLLPVPLGFWATTRLAKSCHKHFADQSRELGALNGLSEEVVGGLAVVRSFGREREALDEFLVVNSRLKAANIKAQSLSGIIPPLMGLVNNLTFAFATLAGGWLVLHGKASLGAITAFTLLARQFARPLSEISTQFNLIQASLAGVERLFEVLDEAPEPETGNLVAPRFQGHVVFRETSFSYRSGVPVLHDVFLEALPGQTIALVGPTGSGKTTIVNLLARFYDPDRGQILVDGVDVRSVERASLRRNLGIVLQDAHLFTGTIRENLLYGNPSAGDDRMREAARMANAEPFILRLARGYETPIAEAGTSLSQGERQLLTIARAILADPAILVLDEATSSVDTRTELHIQEAMGALRKGRTSFVVAHRLSTILQADQILVLDGGRIVDRGTHSELIRREGLYQTLYRSQNPLAEVLVDC